VQKMIDLQRQGVPMHEIEKHADELKTGAREQALGELKLFFIMDAVAEKLGVEVSEEELNGYIADLARIYNRRFDRMRDELAKSNRLESMYYNIRDTKCIDRILEDAKVTEGQAPERPAGKKKEAKKDAGESKTAESKATQAKAVESKAAASAKAESRKPEAKKSAAVKEKSESPKKESKAAPAKKTKKKGE